MTTSKGKKKKLITKIDTEFAIEAFKVLSNYCKQEAHRCSSCIFRDERDICFFYGELLEKRKEFDERK